MSVYGILIATLLLTPWALLLVVLLGAASSAVGRWVGRRRKPVGAASGSQGMTWPTSVASGRDPSDEAVASRPLGRPRAALPDGRRPGGGGAA